MRHHGVAAGTPTPPRFACHFALVGQRRRPLKRTASQLMDARCDDEGGASGAPVQVAVVVAPNLVCGAGGPACECARLRVLFRRMRVWPRSASLCAPLTLDVERRPILCDLKSAALVPRRAYANRDTLGGRQVVRLRRRSACQVRRSLHGAGTGTAVEHHRCGDLRSRCESSFAAANHGLRFAAGSCES